MGGVWLEVSHAGCQTATPSVGPGHRNRKASRSGGGCHKLANDEYFSRVLAFSKTQTLGPTIVGIGKLMRRSEVVDRHLETEYRPA